MLDAHSRMHLSLADLQLTGDALQSLANFNQSLAKVHHVTPSKGAKCPPTASDLPHVLSSSH